MTRIAATILFSCLGLLAFSQGRSTLDAIVETKRFRGNGQGDQLDVNINVIGSTAVWKANERRLLQARVEALTIVEKDSAIVDYRKTEVGGPERSDTLRKDFLHQEHFLLPPGSYVLSIELHDLNGKEDNLTSWRGPLVMPAPQKGITFSDPLLVAGHETSTQGEASVLPFAGTYYPPEVEKLGFYTEVYGTDEVVGRDSNFVLNCQIETYETRQVKGQFRLVQRAKGAPVVPVSVEMPIEALPSGNYLFTVEVVDHQNITLARQEQFIQRNNPLRYDLNSLNSVNVTSTFVDAMNDVDTLAENIACLRPIATDLERRMIDDRWKDRDKELMKRFFYTFWVNRDGFDPERAWLKYKVDVDKANRMYGCRNRRGYETDQGIVFLKYGLPSSVVDGSNDNKQRPYLIWHYYRAGNYSDKRFVFWQGNVGIGCWELLHSEMPGDVKNPNWQVILNQPNVGASTDGTRIYSIEGQRLNDNYDLPH